MYIIKSATGQFFAGHAVAEEGDLQAFWAASQTDRDVQVFARKDVAKKAADFFGGEVVKYQ